MKLTTWLEELANAACPPEKKLEFDPQPEGDTR
jgi:hypothetical protein